ncbi:MAG TPA: ATP-grasp domain-containing protein [Blastocatellia bacterium]|nr:ATP-grasp domain-containing protein [Blastocatellia bacterium]HMX27793.1 ATP-grasp domain-containing protein [Blastocatellia bacterium]HMZ17687.1 ATP-grasp domain-containing protein [Blastocatellia bacterium]HNG32687.1 ATP-grasp domain-containing protein [Blastocatellia bacterium]
MKILVTGAGGPAAVSFMQALADTNATFFMADMDYHASGLYLVPAAQRTLVLPGRHPDFIRDLLQKCRDLKIDVLVPTVDVELVAVAKARKQFELIGVRVLLADVETLELCLDKLKLLIACDGLIPVPRFAVFNTAFDDSDWQYPLIVKPRAGSGSRGVVRVETPAELRKLERGTHLLVQEYLPGEEFSVDVLANQRGEVLATVPRERMKVDSGIAVVSRTLKDSELEQCARLVARCIGLKYVANIQFRRNAQGRPCLLEVNPRFPGTMPLTTASGVNIPLLCLKELFGQVIASEQLFWRELAMVRTWQETYLPAHEITQMMSSAEAEQGKAFYLSQAA